MGNLCTFCWETKTALKNKVHFNNYTVEKTKGIGHLDSLFFKYTSVVFCSFRIVRAPLIFNNS